MSSSSVECWVSTLSMTSLLNMSSLAVACATTVTNYLDLCEDGDRPTLDPATCAPSSVPAGRTAFWMAASAKASRRDRSSVGIGCCSSNVLFSALSRSQPLSFVIRTLFGNKGLALATRQVRWLTFAVRLKELTHGILDAISIRRRQGCSHEPSQREPAGKGREQADSRP